MQHVLEFEDCLKKYFKLFQPGGYDQYDLPDSYEGEH